MAQEKPQDNKEIIIGSIYSLSDKGRDYYRGQMSTSLCKVFKKLRIKRVDTDDMAVEVFGVRINDKGFSQEGNPIVYATPVGKVYFEQELAKRIGIDNNMTMVKEGEHKGKICILLNDPSSWELSVDEIGDIIK